MAERDDTAIAFGPVGLAGWAVLVLGVLMRRRLLAAAGLSAVVVDVTVAELGALRAKTDVPDGSPAFD